MQSFKHYIAEGCRILLGVVFAFSGFVKSVDPQGFAYKLQDYFTAFGLTSLHPIAYVLAFLLVSLEFYVGLLLLFGELRRFSAIVVFAFMAFFTPLTLYLAIANPVTDCGCFGDALKLTNWQTFWKNLPLFIASIYLLWQVWRYKKANSSISCIKCFFLRHIAFPVLLLLLAIFPATWVTIDLPLIDFRPYRIGANLHEGMMIPEGAPQDEYRTEFVYEKDGIRKTFTEFDYPWDDTTWHYVSNETLLVQKGYEPPIHDFALETPDNQNRVNELLATDAKIHILVVTPFLDDLTEQDITTLNTLQTLVDELTLPLFHATAASTDLQADFQSRGLRTTLYTTNERTLKTIVRAKTGVVLLKDAVVLRKWTLSRLPKIEELKTLLQQPTIPLPPAVSPLLWVLLAVFLLLVLAKILLMRLARCPITES